MLMIKPPFEEFVELRGNLAVDEGWLDHHLLNRTLMKLDWTINMVENSNDDGDDDR